MGRRATEIRKGNVLEIDGELWKVIDQDHNTPGNWRAIINLKVKNLRTGQTKTNRHGSGDVLEVAFLENRKCQYLYKDKTTSAYVFMDNENYEQYELSDDDVGEAMKYVVESQIVEMTFHGEMPVDLTLPASVNLRVAESDPAIKGNTVSSVFKRAVLETGLVIKVPMHIAEGEMIKVSSQTGEFQGRAKE